MIIALPLDDTEKLAAHYGGARRVAIYATDDNRTRAPQKRVVTPAPQKPCDWAPWLASEGVVFLLAAGIGNGPVAKMNAVGIAVHAGVYRDDPDAVIADFLADKLGTAKNPCGRGPHPEHDHAHAGCGCDHH